MGRRPKFKYEGKINNLISQSELDDYPNASYGVIKVKEEDNNINKNIRF